MRHAIRMQGRCSILSLAESDFLNSVLANLDKKGIISCIYACLLSHIQASDLLPCREKWESDIGPIVGDSWIQILAAAPLVLVSAAQK